MIEESRKNKSKAEFARTNGIRTQTLDKLGVSSTFFKPRLEEDNFTNHAPYPASEAPSIQLVLTEEYINSHSEKIS